jgi:hypothetical protein
MGLVPGEGGKDKPILIAQAPGAEDFVDPSALNYPQRPATYGEAGIPPQSHDSSLSKQPSETTIFDTNPKPNPKQEFSGYPSPLDPASGTILKPEGRVIDYQPRQPIQDPRGYRDYGSLRGWNGTSIVT